MYAWSVLFAASIGASTVVAADQCLIRKFSQLSVCHPKIEKHSGQNTVSKDDGKTTSSSVAVVSSLKTLQIVCRKSSGESSGQLHNVLISQMGKKIQLQNHTVFTCN